MDVRSSDPLVVTDSMRPAPLLPQINTALSRHAVSQAPRFFCFGANTPAPLTSLPQNYGPTSPISQTQPLDGLVTEQTYLLNSLQQENSKAQDLLRRIPLVQDRVAPSGVPYSARKTQKQLNWLRSRLDETYRQQNAILARLGQLTSQIPSVQRHGQLQTQSQHDSVTSPQLLYQTVQNMRQDVPESMASETPPDSQFPQGWSYEWPQHPDFEQSQPAWHEPAFHTPSFQRASQGYPFPLPASILDDQDSGSISPTNTACLHENRDTAQAEPAPRPRLTHKSSSMNSADHLDILSTHSPLVLSENAGRKRSIPTIPGSSSIWASTKEEIEAGGG